MSIVLNVRILNNELARMWKAAVILVMTVGHWIKQQTQYLPNTKKAGYPFNHNVWNNTGLLPITASK
jgi:hypothetical protein